MLSRGQALSAYLSVRANRAWDPVEKSAASRRNPNKSHPILVQTQTPATAQCGRHQDAQPLAVAALPHICHPPNERTSRPTRQARICWRRAAGARTCKTSRRWGPCDRRTALRHLASAPAKPAHRIQHPQSCADAGDSPRSTRSLRSGARRRRQAGRRSASNNGADARGLQAHMHELVPNLGCKGTHMDSSARLALA